MAALEWPEDVCPASLTWRPESNTKTFRSPFNGASQTVRFPGTRWVCSLTFNNLSDEKSRRIDSLAGSPLVDGANQTGTELHSKGWTAGMVVLRQGDYITVNDELKMVTADVSSASNGTALIPFAPMLRSSPPANAVIEVANPYGIFKLKDNQQGAGNRVPGVFTSYTLEFEEAF